MTRDELLATLHDRGIGARPGTHAVTELAVYRQRQDPGIDSCPRASQLARRTLALPLHNRMTEDDVAHVVSTRPRPLTPVVLGSDWLWPLLGVEAPSEGAEVALRGRATCSAAGCCASVRCSP